MRATADSGEVPQEAADSLRSQLQELEEERKAATAKAESLASKGKRLAEAVTNLQNGALRAMKEGDETAARELLQVGSHGLSCLLQICSPFMASVVIASVITM